MQEIKIIGCAKEIKVDFDEYIPDVLAVDLDRNGNFAGGNCLIPPSGAKYAVTIAKERGIPVEMIDRDVGITVKRGFWVLPYTLIIKSFLLVIPLLIANKVNKKRREGMDRDHLIKEYKKAAPSAYKVLFNEREAYMAHKLIELAEKYDRILAVISATNIAGVEKYLNAPMELPPIDSLINPKPGRD